MSAESIPRGRPNSTGNSPITWAGPAAEQHHPVAQPDRLAHLVGDEQDRELAPPPDALQDLVEQVPGHRVERAERLVHQQHIRVLSRSNITTS